MAKARWTILALLAALVVAILALGGAALAHQEGTTVFPSATSQTEGSSHQLRVEKPGSGNPGPLSPTQKLAMKQGYLVPDQDAYERAKAAAQRLAGGGGKTTYAAAQGAVPETFRSWEGIRNRKGGTPSDSTGAIGNPLHRTDQCQVRDLRPDQQPPHRHRHPQRTGRGTAPSAARQEERCRRIRSADHMGPDHPPLLLRRR